MLDHVSIGVRDIARSKRFYDAALAPLGYKCLHDGASMLGYGGDSVTLWISPSERPVPAEPGSGLHFCFAAPGPDAVGAFHKAALAAGGRDNGAPGPRPDYSPITTPPSPSTRTVTGLKPIAAKRDGRERSDVRREPKTAVES